jgi:hypothetical protein
MTRFLKHGSFPYVSSTLIATVLNPAGDRVRGSGDCITTAVDRAIFGSTPGQPSLSPVAHPCWRTALSLAST